MFVATIAPSSLAGFAAAAAATPPRIHADPADVREYWVSDDWFGSWMSQCLAKMIAGNKSYVILRNLGGLARGNQLGGLINECQLESLGEGFSGSEQMDPRDLRRWEEFSAYLDCLGDGEANAHLWRDHVEAEDATQPEQLWEAVLAGARRRCHHTLPDSIVLERIRAGSNHAAAQAAKDVDADASAATTATTEDGTQAPSGHRDRDQEPETGFQAPPPPPPDFSAFMARVGRLLRKPKVGLPMMNMPEGFGLVPL
ncbi:MAG: hypothetical protein M1816_008073 [Peltula sp. TS41687]|nr:MAG: hypothetical protein M1816_008073 [Peltula sp. TS41687]